MVNKKEKSKSPKKRKIARSVATGQNVSKSKKPVQKKKASRPVLPEHKLPAVSVVAEIQPVIHFTPILSAFRDR